jgi:hypothetical protein
MKQYFREGYVRGVCSVLCAFVIAGCGGDDKPTSSVDPANGGGASNTGGGAGLDTDSDGIPDARDLDADGDGIPNADEMGDDATPTDTDADGTPDYQDNDADDDGILDTDELDESFEIVDTDDDGVPDFRDLDSDGDGITDAQEGHSGLVGIGGGVRRGVYDADGDDVPDFRDLDSDSDGIPDECEGDDDSDTDDVPAFRDLDSDDDGIADGEEDADGNCEVDAGESSPQSADSDDDGVPDLVEKIAGTDPSDDSDKIPDTDFYFILPYKGPRGDGQLDFSTSVRQADIFFSIDNTGSMEGETANIQENLVSTIIPQISDVIPNAAFGVARFRDFPIDPYGLTADVPYELGQVITTDSSLVGDAIAALPAPGGGLDIPEAGFEALFQWASGAGLPAFGMPAFQSNAPSGIGGAGFRRDSLPILVHITDAVAHDPTDYVGFSDAAHGYDQAVAALNGIGARVIGINSLENEGTEFEPRSQLEDLAVATRATIPPDADGECKTGVAGAAHDAVEVNGSPRCPVVFDVATDGSGLSGLIVDAIEELATLADLDVSTRPLGKLEGERGEVIPKGTTTADFIKSITPVPPPPAGATIDGDIFRSVKPGSTVTFELDAYNDFVRHTDKDQLFTIDIQVLGDGVTVLDTRKVFVIVPKEIKPPSVPK